MNKFCKNIYVSSYEFVGERLFIALCKDHEKEYDDKRKISSSMEIPCGKRFISLETGKS